MDSLEIIKTLEKIKLKSYYGKEVETLFLPKDKSEVGKRWKKVENYMIEILNSKEEYILVRRIYEILAQDYYRHFFYHYVITYQECYHAKCKKTKELFSFIASCTYLDIFFHYQFRKTKKITKKYDVEVIFKLHKLVLAGWWSEVKEILAWIMEDIIKKDNSKTFFLNTEYPYIHKMAWFMLRLLSKSFNYNLDDSYYPILDKNSKEWEVYSHVVNIWDIEDLIEVDKQVYLLCELFLMDGIKNENGQRREEEVCEAAAENYLTPYPILVWLKLREYSGLINPVEFTHPLMNHPFVIYFQGSLEKPKKIPFLEELVGFIEKKEPNIDFPLIRI